MAHEVELSPSQVTFVQPKVSPDLLVVQVSAPIKFLRVIFLEANGVESLAAKLDPFLLRLVARAP
jgi:hypothetical protein